MEPSKHPSQCSCCCSKTKKIISPPKKNYIMNKFSSLASFFNCTPKGKSSTILRKCNTTSNTLICTDKPEQLYRRVCNKCPPWQPCTCTKPTKSCTTTALDLCACTSKSRSVAIQNTAKLVDIVITANQFWRIEVGCQSSWPILSSSTQTLTVCFCRNCKDTGGEDDCGCSTRLPCARNVDLGLPCRCNIKNPSSPTVDVKDSMQVMQVMKQPKKKDDSDNDSMFNFIDSEL